MSGSGDSYWSIEACGWVRSPAADEPRTDVALPRPTEAPDARLDLTAGAVLDAEEPTGVPV